MLGKFFFLALFAIIALIGGKHILMVDRGMCCDLIHISKPIVLTAYPGSDCGGSSSSRGPQTSVSLVSGKFDK